MLAIAGKLIFSLLCLLGTFSYSKVLIHSIREQVQNPEQFLALGLGGLAYTILWVMLFARRRPFWSVVEHELTHALFALITFRKVHSFSVDRVNGGRVEIEGDNFMIALSPYFFPVFTVFILLIKPSIVQELQWLLNLMLGFSLMFHFIHLSQEFHPSQPDLKKNGIIFSLVVVFFFNVFFIGLSIASLNGELSQMESFVRMGYTDARETILALIA